jgi:hypothetical protein
MKILGSNGNVGIGTNPGAKLDVFSSSTDPGAVPTLHVGDGALDYGDYGMLQLTRHPTTGGSKAHAAFIRSGNSVFGMGFHNNTNTFGFWPSFSTVTNTPAMSFASGGNVGIGTASPGAKLHVHGSENTTDSSFSMRVDRWKTKTWFGNIGASGTNTDVIIFDRSARGSSNGGEICGELHVFAHRSGGNQHRAYALIQVNYTHWYGATWYGSRNVVIEKLNEGISDIDVISDTGAGTITVRITSSSSTTGQYYIKFDGPVYEP